MGCIFAKQAVTGAQSRAGPLAEQVEPVSPFEHRGPTNGSEGSKAHAEPLHIWANDVKNSHEQLPSVQASELDAYISGPSVLGGTKATKRILEGFSHDYKDPSNDLEGCPFVYPSSDNPLIAAAHMAFYRHLPLALHPDTLWVCILKGIAHHVYNYVPTGEGNPVTGKGKKIELSVRDDTLVLGPGGRGKNNWAAAIDGWCSQINSHIGSRLPMVSEAMRLRFSTSTQCPATQHLREDLASATAASGGSAQWA